MINKKNTLIGISAIIALLAIAFLVYQFIFNTIQQRQTTREKKELTEEEKIMKRQIDELDALRAQYREQNTVQATTTAQAQMKSMDALKDKTLKQKTVQSKKTMSQQMNELDALRLHAQMGTSTQTGTSTRN